MPGILTSSSTASKRAARNSGMACSPVTASAMSKPSVPNVVRSARRIDGSSSTINLPCDASPHSLEPPLDARKRQKERGSFSLLALHPSAP